MIDLKDFLGKFRVLVKDKKDQKRVIVKVVKSSTGVSLNEESIDINTNNLIFINCQPALKSEIFLRKKDIIKNLNSELSPQKFKEIL